jgi:hypothetical protein
MGSPHQPPGRRSRPVRPLPPAAAARYCRLRSRTDPGRAARTFALRRARARPRPGAPPFPRREPETGPAEDDLLRHLPRGLRQQAPKLGQPLLLCPFQGGSTEGAIAGMVVGGLVCLVGLAIVGFWAVIFFAGKDRRLDGMSLVLLGAAAFAFVAGGSIFSAAAKGWGNRGVLLFEKGLVSLRPGKPAVWPWDEVEAVWLDIAEIRNYLAGVRVTSPCTWHCTVQGGGHEDLVLTHDLRGVERLVRAVAQGAYEARLPGLVRAHRAGKAVNFQVLKVSRTGLSRGSKSLPWSDVGGVAIENGTFAVLTKDGRRAWYSQPVRDVPNALVLAALIDTILRRDPDFRRYYAGVRFVGQQAV